MRFPCYRYNPDWVELDDEDSDPDWLAGEGSQYKSTAADRAKRVRKRDYSPETIRRMIAECDIPEGVDVHPSYECKVKLKRCKVTDTVSS